MAESVMSVNDFIKDEITKINYTLIPPGCEDDVRTLRMIQETLGNLIDALGVQSAAAQGLTKAITSAERLRNAHTHLVYILKDATANNGHGELIGFLKVAFKHLYFFNEGGTVSQVEPLCVLDFYISSARQRRGYGKKLFDFMLEDNSTQPHVLAVDGPSKKMEAFLAKNYGMDDLILQNNNFAVSSAFFDSASSTNESGRTTPALPTPAVGRFAARQPPSSMSDIIHGAKEHTFVPKNGTPVETNPAAPPRLPSPRPPPSPEPERESVSAASSSAERPTTLPVAPANLAAPPPAPAAAGSVSPRRESQLNVQGFLDLKFYHNKLW